MNESRPSTCRFCSSYNYEWTPRCQVCGRHGGPVPEGMHFTVEVQPTFRTLAGVAGTKGERVHSSMPTVDRVFGTNWRTLVSGVHVPSVTLLAGPPGNGKSSLLLQYAATCSGRVLYLLSEQSLSGLRDVADRCGLTDAQLSRINVEHVESIDDGIELCRTRKPKVTIYDSFSDLIPPEGDRQANAILLMKKIVRDATKHDRAVICVAHVNRDDEIALARRVEHEVDAVLRFDAFGEELRLLHCPSKNRFGKIGVKSWFVMGEKGLAVCDEPENDPTEKKGRLPI